MNQFEYTTKEFAAEVARRAGRPCSWRTVQNWRIAHDGHAARLLPTRYERKGRIAIYTEEQILVAVALLGAKYSSDESNLFAYTKKDTVPVDATIEADGSEGDSGSDDTNAVEIDSPVYLESTESITPTADDESTAAATLHKGINLHDYGWDDVEAAIGENYTEDAELADARKKADTVPADVQSVRVASKDFLPMTTTPNFAAIPQVMKSLKRFLCWRLIPAEPKAKKVPMTPKNGKLVNAAVNNPDNWLTFDEAISWYKRGLCTGIGFALTNAAPKICCVDVDHCFAADGTLTAEALNVVATVQNSWTEKSQSATGLHIWFVDDDFNGGRRKGNVEVYAADRYIALTGVRVVGTAEDLLTVNGGCRAVISKFIDAGAGSLFADNSPARADDGQAPPVKLTAEDLKSSSPLSDDDRRLIEYFHSEKCRDRDLNMFNLFSGNVGEYFKAQGKPLDDSVADAALLAKILYYVGGAGTDAEIGQRALKIFGQSELAKRDKWTGREDYRLRTLEFAFKAWVDGGRKAYQSKTRNDSDAAQIEQLKAELRDVMKALADFDARKKSGLEKLRNVEVFDSATVFNDDMLDAAAFAYRDDKKTFSDFKRAIVNYGNTHRDEKISVNDWLVDVKEHAAIIARQHKDLLTRRNEIQAQIDALTFAADNDALAGLTFPVGYSVNPKYGILKAAGEDMITVCRRPVVIKGMTYSVDEKIYKTTLSYQSKTGKWKNLPAQENATVSDKSKIVGLANVGLPVTSSNAKLLVDYLDAFKAENETTLPLTYQTSRGGWYKFGGSDMFVDNRRQCVFTDDEDRQVSVEVDTSRSQFANALTTAGTIEEWKHAYMFAKPSPIARLVVAAAVAPPLLKILGERNFMLYIQAPTRAGKSTALMLAASAVGSEKIVRSFDATKNGLAGVAADVSDYPLMIDEKQAADGKLKDCLTDLVYLLVNGVSRTKLHRTSKVMDLSNWRTIVLANGETQLLPDNATDGADTRLMTVAAPDKILDADTCKLIRDIIKENYGLIFPRVVDEILKYGSNTLRGIYADIVAAFAESKPKILPEHRRYLAVLTLADALLNSALGMNSVTLADGRTLKAIDDATLNANEIFALIPTMDELSNARKARDFVISFIAQNQNRFIGGNVVDAKIQQFYGKLRDADGYTYIMAKTLRDACKADGWDYRKLVADLVAEGFFVPRDKLKKNRHTPTPTVPKNISEIKNAECYRIPNEIFDAVD